MKCKKARQNIILYLYDELTDKEKNQLKAHLAECPECAKELEETRRALNLVNEAEPDELPEGSWDQCWEEIRSGISPKSKKSFLSLPIPRWAAAAASVLFVFALGVFLGRMWFQTPSAIEETVSSAPLYTAQLQEYIGSVEPVLLDYTNQSGTPGEKETIAVDAALLKNLLLQNYVLKQMVAEEDPQAAQMLEDLELVLREIINRSEDDPAAPGMIRDLINQRDILFKMDVLREI